jgi:hypothetical protein
MNNKRNALRKYLLNATVASLLFIVLSGSAVASPVVRQGSGADRTALQTIVDLFRADLGGTLNPNNGQSFINGRREISWDDVPDNLAEPNNLPANFFNLTSPRGVVFSAIEDATGAALNRFAVSADADSGTAVRFGNINGSYSGIFQTFSSQRLFIARSTHMLIIRFLIPGTNIPATVSGFGLVLADVDSSTGGNRSVVRFYGADGTQLSAASAPVFNNGLSFVGVSFNAGERIASVVIESGNAGLSALNTDGVNGVDVVAMDDMIYGEPRAARSHSADYDGDGTSDFAVFRPGTGLWFFIDSGTGLHHNTQFGQNGDIPVDGDFDGDSRTDIAVFRPSSGTWLIQRSSDGQLQTSQFGANSDKPVPADYDQDGKTDIAVYRSALGSYLILRSSDGQFQQQPLGGALGDTPIQASAAP